MEQTRRRVFISYSHEDRRWLERLTDVLAPLVRAEEIALWDDREIAPGAVWTDEIDRALTHADVAVLLVTPTFLASEFVSTVEVPRLVAAADAGRLTLVWVAVSSTLVDRTPLARFQAANDPARPLDQLSRARANEALVEVAKAIASGSTLTSVAQVLRAVDEVKNELAEVSGHPTSSQPYSVVAHHTGQEIEFRSRDHGTLETITVADLARLEPRQQQLIQSLQTSMYNEFDRWTALYPRRSTLTPSEEKALQHAAAAMCSDLTSIFRFLGMIGKYLDDHYSEVTIICRDFAAPGS